MPIVSIALALAQYAPQLMRFFGAGDTSVAVAQQVVGLAQGMTGATTPEAALEQIRASAEFQRQFALRSLELDAQLESAFLADVQSAREHDIEVRRLAGGANKRADIMLALAFLAVIVIAALLALGKVSGADAIGGFLITIGGMFARNIGTAFDFEFGSSRGSKDKDDVIASLSRAPQPPAPIAERSSAAQ